MWWCSWWPRAIIRTFIIGGHSDSKEDWSFDQDDYLIWYRLWIGRVPVETMEAFYIPFSLQIRNDMMSLNFK